MRVDDRSLVAAFYVDVNSASESGQVGTTTASMVDGLTVDPASVQPGMYVLAVDADENACVALVTARGDDWLQLHMDEGTWKPLAELSGGWSHWIDERVSLAPLNATDALRAMLRTRPKD